MSNYCFVILAYSRPSRLQLVIDSIHRFVQYPKILVYIDKANEQATNEVHLAQAQIMSLCNLNLEKLLITDYAVSEVNQGTKKSYFSAFDLGFRFSRNVIVLEDDMVLISNPTLYIDSCIKIFNLGNLMGMAVLYSNFEHPRFEKSLRVTNWPTMWGVMLSFDHYLRIKRYLNTVDSAEIEKVVVRFSESNLIGILQKVFQQRFNDTWKFKFNRAFESRWAWDTHWHFALWALHFRCLAPAKSLIADLGTDKFSVSAYREKIEPKKCKSAITDTNGAFFWCRACELARESSSLPRRLTNNGIVSSFISRGIL